MWVVAHSILNVNFFSGYSDILYLHRKKNLFSNRPWYLGVLFDDIAGCSHLLLLCLEGSRALSSRWRHFFLSRIAQHGSYQTIESEEPTRSLIIYMAFLWTPQWEGCRNGYLEEKPQRQKNTGRMQRLWGPVIRPGSVAYLLGVLSTCFSHCILIMAMWESLTILVNWPQGHISMTLIASPMMHRKLCFCVGLVLEFSLRGRRTKPQESRAWFFNDLCVQGPALLPGRILKLEKMISTSLPPLTCYLVTLGSSAPWFRKEKKKCIDYLFSRSQIASLTLFCMWIFTWCLIMKIMLWFNYH